MKPSSGFPPLVSGEPTVLILGSLPSRKSLERQEYYAHPRNAFWPIMGELFDAGPNNEYAERVSRLTGSGIAVWDVLQSSVRPGSLDSSIVEEASEPNDFEAFFEDYPTLEMICFNGRMAEHLYRRLVSGNGVRVDQHRFVSLPSTSPAHAAMTFAQKLNRWMAVRNGAMQ